MTGRRGLSNLFERISAGAYRAPEIITDLGDPFVREKLDESDYLRVVEELEMLEIAGKEYSAEQVLSGQLTPVFFGSAMNNFGVQLLLDSFLERSAPPAPHLSGDRVIQPDDPLFSGFVFKIQANMDPRHRDRIAFVRVCSGKFERDMVVTHSQTGEKVRLSSSHKLFGQERETIDEAYAGDIVGLVGHSTLGIGDTLTQGPSDYLSRDSALPAGVLQLSAQSESRQVQAIPQGDGSIAAGRGDPGLPLAQCRPARPAAGGGGAACNLRWCNTGWSPSTARLRAWKQRHGNR